MNDTIISFWQTQQHLNIIRVFYFSYTDRDKTLVADVDRDKNLGVMYIANGENADRNKDILPFIDAVMNKNTMQGYRRLKHTGNDMEIVEQTYDTICQHLSQMDDANENYSGIYNLKLHVESFLSYDYTYVDGTTLYGETIRDMLEDYYIVHFAKYGNRKSCYCGITNDIDIRMDQHRQKDFAISYNKVFAVLCVDKADAIRVESMMSNDFSVSSNRDLRNEQLAGKGAIENTRYVYLLKKGEEIRN